MKEVIHHIQQPNHDTSKDEGHTKEDTGKSMKHALYLLYCGMPRGTHWDEAKSNTQIIKLVALAVSDLGLSEGIS